MITGSGKFAGTFNASSYWKSKSKSCPYVLPDKLPCSLVSEPSDKVCKGCRWYRMHADKLAAANKGVEVND